MRIELNVAAGTELSLDNEQTEPGYAWIYVKDEEGDDAALTVNLRELAIAITALMEDSDDEMCCE